MENAISFTDRKLYIFSTSFTGSVSRSVVNQGQEQVRSGAASPAVGRQSSKPDGVGDETPGSMIPILQNAQGLLRVAIESVKQKEQRMQAENGA